ncbi:hypothetical protein [Nocardia wallacei]|uniref:hypothetical protein n=1 Tax=Nocardia wallacei TaxID=480035 RepID=UPI002455E11D|nr:hypothetical protein [Nocardia wallacei]
MPDLTKSLERERKQTIVWMPLPEHAPSGLCGLEFYRRDTAVVFHQRSADPSHYRRVIAHAAAHMLLDHNRDSAVAPVVAAALLTGEGDDVIDAQDIESIFPGEERRRAEAEAEELASFLLEQPGCCAGAQRRHTAHDR